MTHIVHVVCFMEFVYWPATHEVQLAAPPVAENMPLAHVLHAELAPVEYHPGRQFLHALEALWPKRSLDFPAPHALQVVASVAPRAVLNVPLPHGVHPPVEPVTELVPFSVKRYVPASQNLHTDCALASA